MEESNADTMQQAGTKAAFIELARELSESGEHFPFPGIDSEVLARMRAADAEFEGYTTPIDALEEKLRAQGMIVYFSKTPESGNVYIVPAANTNVLTDDAYISPKQLQTNDGMDERVRALIRMDREGFR